MCLYFVLSVREVLKDTWGRLVGVENPSVARERARLRPAMGRHLVQGVPWSVPWDRLKAREFPAIGSRLPRDPV